LRTVAALFALATRLFARAALCLGGLGTNALRPSRFAAPPFDVLRIAFALRVLVELLAAIGAITRFSCALGLSDTWLVGLLATFVLGVAGLAERVIGACGVACLAGMAGLGFGATGFGATFGAIVAVGLGVAVLRVVVLRVVPVVLLGALRVTVLVPVVAL